MSDNRPFAGRKLSRAERKAAEERARRRAAARAVALPPPDPSTRVDNPLAPRPADRTVPDAPAAPATGRSPYRGTPAGRPPVTGEVPLSKPAATSVAPPSARRSLADLHPADMVDRRPVRSRLRAAVLDDLDGPRGRTAFAVGLPSAVAGVVCATIASDVVPLGHPFDRTLLACGVAAAALGALFSWRGRRACRAWQRRAGLAATVVVLAAFVVGAATGPVVIDGKVYLSTSTTAHAHALAMQMRTDLYRISALDKYAAYSQEDARANVDVYPDIANELEDMNTRYAALQATAPTPHFADAIGHLRAAAHWESQALQAKAKLIDQADAQLTSDVASYRNTAWNESLTAANTLQAAANQFHFSVTADQNGPHE